MNKLNKVWHWHCHSGARLKGSVWLFAEQGHEVQLGDTL
jgi:hypothetical protein